MCVAQQYIKNRSIAKLTMAYFVSNYFVGITFCFQKKNLISCECIPRKLICAYKKDDIKKNYKEGIEHWRYCSCVPCMFMLILHNLMHGQNVQNVRLPRETVIMKTEAFDDMFCYYGSWEKNYSYNYLSKITEWITPITLSAFYSYIQ